MQEVWLFGDSYAQTEPPQYDTTIYQTNKDFVSWPNRLKKTYNLKNFAQGGTGPSWSLNLLHNEIIKNNNLKDVNLIFFISAIWRLDLAFYKNVGDQCLTSKIPAPDYNMINFGWDIFDITDVEKKAIKPYLHHKTFVKDLWKYYLLTDSFQNTELLKIIGNLKLYSELFKKVLVWPIFHKSLLNVQSTANFYFVKELLFEIEKDPFGYGIDHRHNHLSEENHAIMLKQISDWIDYSIPIDINKFIKK